MKNILYKKINSSVLYFERNIKDYFHFCEALKNHFQDQSKLLQPVFLCIGTDRITGDCLGPLVGEKLQKYYQDSPCIFGTLEHPVHALNLQYVITKIRLQFTNPFIIVTDAALGLPGHIGNITLSPGPLFPGEGMQKNLSPVGDLAITGIVNSCHGNASLLLQNTRLHLVNQLADFIASGLISCFHPSSLHSS